MATAAMASTSRFDSDDGTYLRAKLKAKLGSAVTATLWAIFRRTRATA